MTWSITGRQIMDSIGYYNNPKRLFKFIAYESSLACFVNMNIIVTSSSISE